MSIYMLSFLLQITEMDKWTIEDFWNTIKKACWSSVKYSVGLNDKVIDDMPWSYY